MSGKYSKNVVSQSATLQIESTGDNEHVAYFTDLKTGKSLTPPAFGYMRSKLNISDEGLLEELRAVVGEKIRLIRLFSRTIETPRSIYTCGIVGCKIQIRDTQGKFKQTLEIGQQIGEHITRGF